MKLFDDDFAERIAAGLKRSARATETLGKLGWTVPMNFTPREVVEVVELGSEEAIDRFFETYYFEGNAVHLRTLVERTAGSPLLERWAPLIKESHASFEAVGHLVVIPALLTVVEGGVAQLGQRLERKADIVRVVRETRNSYGEDRLTYAMWNSVYWFVDSLFKSSSFGRDRPSTLNRHWILHGRDLPEWSRADALRLFHALGTLVNLNHRVEKKRLSREVEK